MFLLVDITKIINTAYCFTTDITCLLPSVRALISWGRLQTRRILCFLISGWKSLGKLLVVWSFTELFNTVDVTSSVSIYLYITKTQNIQLLANQIYILKDSFFLYVLSFNNTIHLNKTESFTYASGPLSNINC